MKCIYCGEDAGEHDEHEGCVEQSMGEAMRLQEGAGFAPVAALHEWPDNPKTITPEDLQRLKRSVEADPEMLDARPLLTLPDGTVIGGNQRLKAVRELGWEYVAVFVKDLPPGRAREWALRDNNTYGSWEHDALAEMLRDHKAQGGDIELTGFSVDEADALIASLGDDDGGLGDDPRDPDQTPPAPAQAMARLGDIYVLGEHMLACGDAGAEGVWTQLFDSDLALTQGPADCLWTDPPYGVGYNPEDRAGAGQVFDFSDERLAAPLGEIANDEHTGADYAEWLTKTLLPVVERMAPGAAAYLCHAGLMGEWATRAFRQAGLHLAEQLIWAKTRIVFGRADYHWQHEPILYGWRPGAAHSWEGDRTQGTFYETASDHYAHREQGYAHPTQKPVELVEWNLRNSCAAGALVLDPFAGAGTTLVACERVGLRCRAVELDPRYVDVIVARWVELTGHNAQLVAGPDLGSRTFEPDFLVVRR